MSDKITKFGNDSNNQIFVKLNTDKLQQIEKELKKNFVVQVGILGAKAAGRQNAGKRLKGGGHKVGDTPAALTNAEIGFIHEAVRTEKGSKAARIPRRSFLEIPLTKIMPTVMNKVGEAILNGLSAGNIEKAYGKLGAIAEGVVQGAFSSSGYGDWPPNAPSTIARKGSSRPLIDTAQLRQSISSRVVSQ